MQHPTPMPFGQSFVDESEMSEATARVLGLTPKIEQSERDEIKAELIRMRQYVMRKGLGIGECVAWCKIKERFGIGIRDADDEQWLQDYESRKKTDDWPPPCSHGVKGPCGECRS
jgi:hypothetical protein